MVEITCSFVFPDVSPFAHPETRKFVGDEKDFAAWTEKQTGPGGKWIKWHRQSTVRHRA